MGKKPRVAVIHSSLGFSAAGEKLRVDTVVSVSLGFFFLHINSAKTDRIRRSFPVRFPRPGSRLIFARSSSTTPTPPSFFVQPTHPFHDVAVHLHPFIFQHPHSRFHCYLLDYLFRFPWHRRSFPTRIASRYLSFPLSRSLPVYYVLDSNACVPILATLPHRCSISVTLSTTLTLRF